MGLLEREDALAGWRQAGCRDGRRSSRQCGYRFDGAEEWVVCGLTGDRLRRYDHHAGGKPESCQVRSHYGHGTTGSARLPGREQDQQWGGAGVGFKPSPRRLVCERIDVRFNRRSNRSGPSSAAPPLATLNAKLIGTYSSPKGSVAPAANSMDDVV